MTRSASEKIRRRIAKAISESVVGTTWDASLDFSIATQRNHDLTASVQFDPDLTDHARGYTPDDIEER
jgi:hypothetical protein